jgi:hypothetical protein
MFIGYAEDHTSNVFKFYNPKTYAFILSIHVYLLNKSYGEFYNVRPTDNDNQLRQAHRHIAKVTFDLPDRKDPPSNAVARAMIPHFNPIQPPEPDELPPPNFDNDNASIPSDASPPDSPVPATIDSATTTDEPYSWTRIPRVSGMSRIATALTSSYNPAPLASTSPTLSEASDDTASTSPSEEAELALEDYCAPHEMAFATGLHEITVYPQNLRAALSTPHHLDWWKAVCTEFENCETKQVWTIVKKSNVPIGRRIIGNRWVSRAKITADTELEQLLKVLAKFQVNIFKKTCPCH